LRRKRWLLVSLMLPLFASAQVDCTLLDPRVSVSSEKEGKISVALGTLYKVAKVDAGIEGKLKDEIKNLQSGSGTVSESLAVAARTIYLFCGMVANAKDISRERKFELFTILQATIRDSPIEQASRKLGPSVAPTKKSETAMDGRPALPEWEFRSSTFGRSCEYSATLSPKGARLRLEASTSIVKGLRFGVVFTNSPLFSGKFFEIRDLDVSLSIDGTPTRLRWEGGIPDDKGILGLSTFDYFWSVGGTAPQYNTRRQKLAAASDLSVQLSGLGRRYPPVKLSALALMERIKRRECPYADVAQFLDEFTR